MKIIGKIARAELRNLFYSPIAWAVILIFYTLSAASVMLSLAEHANIQEVSKKFDPNWMGFDGKGVQGFTFGGAISSLFQYVYLIIPLLTMGVINREVTNGTSKLLFSSPVTNREIVLGKFLGLIVFNLFILCMLAIPIYAFCLSIEIADFNWVLSMFLGFFLLMSAFAAIGMFLSSVTNYQIVAAILTFAVFVVLASLTKVGQQYDLIREITFALSIAGKGSFMIFGLITSRDIIYFLLIIFLFISFTIIKLDSTQQAGNKRSIIARYGISILVVMVLGYFSSRPVYTAYLDVTDTKKMTVLPVVQDALKTMDGTPLTVTLYTNLLGKNAAMGLPQSRNMYLMAFWESYTRFYPNTIFKYEYYYDLMDGDSSYYRQYPGKNIDEIAAIEAEILGIRTSLFKKPAAIRELIQLDDEKLSLVMQLEYKGKKTFLRTYQGGGWPDQQNVAASVMRLTREKAVQVSFATGHFERDAFEHTRRDYYFNTRAKGNSSSLINNGVDIDTVALLTENINPATNLLVVADPKTDYSTSEQAKIINWINNGGNAMILTEPGKQHILAPVLKEIGVYPDDGIIVRPHKHHSPVLFPKIPLTKTGNFMAKERNMQLFQDYDGYKGVIVNLDGVISLEYTATKGFNIEPIITLPGNAGTWIKKGKLVVDSAAPVFTPAEGDTRKQEYVTGIQLTRNINGREQRIIVAGDADFLTPNRLQKLGLALYSFTLNNAYPLYANKPLPLDRYIRISSISAIRMANLFIYGFSGIILLTAIIILVRRKRK